MKALQGVGVALITPFKSDLSVDIPALKKLVEHVSTGGVDYLVVMGTTGESPVCSPEEVNLILHTVQEANSRNLPIVLGLGGNHTQGVSQKIQSLQTHGITAILSVSPYYNKPNQEGIFRHYTALADQSQIPLILYNVPGRTGSNMTAETTLRLSEHPNIMGVKEASGNLDQCMEILQHKPHDFMVISGDDALTFPYITLGMQGVISVIANVLPHMFSNMVHAAMEQNIDQARKLHYALLPIMNLIFADGSPGGVKVISQEIGIGTDSVRPPLFTVNDKVREQILQAFKVL